MSNEQSEILKADRLFNIILIGTSNVADNFFNRFLLLLYNFFFATVGLASGLVMALDVSVHRTLNSLTIMRLNIFFKISVCWTRVRA